MKELEQRRRELGRAKRNHRRHPSTATAVAVRKAEEKVREAEQLVGDFEEPLRYRP